MMRSFKTGSVILAGAVLMTVTGCRKEKLLPETFNHQTAETKTAPATSTGANTFSCRINGEVWVPQGDFSGMGSLKPVNANFANGKLYVYGIKSVNKTGRKGETQFQTVAVTVFSDFSNDVKLTASDGKENNTFSNARGFFTDWEPGNCEYETDKNHEGSLKILHHDTNNRNISGTFEFKAFSKECNKSIQVTDGKFDVRY